MRDGRARWPMRLALGVIAVAVGVGVGGNAAYAATLTVNPNSNLTNGQSVTITGSGFPANATLVIVECVNADGDGNALASETQNCYPPGAKTVTADGSGNVPSTAFTVYEEFEHPAGGPRSCIPNGTFACYVRISEATASAEPVKATITFAQEGGSSGSSSTTTTSTTSSTTTTVGDGGTTTTTAGSGGTTTTAVTTAVAGNETARGQSLPTTGSPTLTLAAVGALLLVLGAMATTVAGWRRRPARARR